MVCGILLRGTAVRRRSVVGGMFEGLWDINQSSVEGSSNDFRRHFEGLCTGFPRDCAAELLSKGNRGSVEGSSEYYEAEFVG